jgi:bifunctional UDP-N-acetylglucosamine pyrophosphorylase/glucosamine-1-phosphate N-acetyltransferase
VVKRYHKGLWNLYSRFESWPASQTPHVIAAYRNWPPRVSSPATGQTWSLSRIVTTTAQPQHTERIAVAVLAAGQGTRMKSSTPKHLHPVAGVPIVERVIRAGLAISPHQLVAIVSPEMTDLATRLGMEGEFEVTPQVHPYGTAGAVRTALDYLEPSDWLVSLLGDSPLLTGETVRHLVDGARASGCKVTILSCILPDARSYGRIERNANGHVTRIVEKKNDQAHHRQGDTEINSGIMVLDTAWARETLASLPVNPDTNELMLTDIVEFAINRMAPGDPWPVSAVVGHSNVSLGINDRVEQAAADAVIRRNVRERLQRNGVTIIGGDNVFIDETVSIGADTIVHPFSVITGDTVIGRHCVVGPHAVLHNATLHDRAQVRSSTVTDSEIGTGSDIGPYAHIRGNTIVGPDVHVGTSAELKNSSLGSGSKMGHFSYLGDAILGENVNVGAGTITANFDGVSKHPTAVGDNVFLGSDTVLVAPVRIGDDARTGAGAVVTRDVEERTTVVGVPARRIASEKPNSRDTGE